MAAVNFFLGCIDVNQNVNLFDAVPSFVEEFPNTHYRLDLNADMEVLLGIAGNYQQNSLDANRVNINLDLTGNHEYLKKLLGYPSVYDNGGAVTANFTPKMNAGPNAEAAPSRKGVVIGMSDSATENIGFRFLEIAAVQIFNHARARAAIRNDTDFVTSMRETVTDISDKINVYTAINADGGVKDDIFNQYVQQNLLVNYPANDVDAVVPFNFQSFNFDGYKTGIQINFNMPFIKDSTDTAIIRDQYGVAADPAVNILLVFHHRNLWGIPA